MRKHTPSAVAPDQRLTKRRTIFQTNDTWPMMDCSDPLTGWDIHDIIDHAPPAKQDQYGGLFFLLRKTLLQFCHKIRTINLHIQLFNVDVVDLPQTLSSELFDRIEISNIIDHCWLGPDKPLIAFSPLLRSKAENPHAAIVRLFFNAINEIENPMNALPNVQTLQALEGRLANVKKYLPRPSESEWYMTSAIAVRFTEAGSMFRNIEELWRKFVVACDLEGLSLWYGLCMRETHRIVEEWPCRLRDGASQEEFDILHATNYTGRERSLEWELI